MERLRIRGGKPLQGTVRISGAKNSALPILTASLLTKKQLVVSNLPHLQDITTMVSLLTSIGMDVQFRGRSCLSIQPNEQVVLEADHGLIHRMRAAILVLGPLLSHYGTAKVSLPGGCDIGERPIELHLQALRAMGADIEVKGNYIYASAPDGLHGTTFRFDPITVTGTENIVMAASLAKGRTVLENCAQEPEVVDLVECLLCMGARISGHGSDTIVIDGVDALHGAEHTVLPDRIETGTYLVATVAAQGKVRVEKTNPQLLSVVVDALREMGASIACGEDWVEIESHARPRPLDIVTAPYPLMPTDMQAQFMALNCVAAGNSTITETIFENRFGHAQELQQMGADIRIEGANKAYICGVASLNPATILATDLRASASLIIAGLVAPGGDTIIEHIHHIDRGYETIEEKLHLLGVDIQRLAV